MAKPLKSINYYKEYVQNNMTRNREKQIFYNTLYFKLLHFHDFFSEAEKSFSYIMKKLFHQHKNPDI